MSQAWSLRYRAQHLIDSLIAIVIRAQAQADLRLSRRACGQSQTTSKATRVSPWSQINLHYMGSPRQSHQRHKNSLRHPPSHSPANYPPSLPKAPTPHLTAVHDHPKRPNQTSSPNKTKVLKNVAQQTCRKTNTMSSRSTNKVRTSGLSMTPHCTDPSAEWRQK